MSPTAKLWLWRAAAWALAGAPLLMLAWRTLHNDLGPNPVETLEHTTGDWALRLLLVTLAMTPLRRLSGWSQPLRVRRLLGLWAFFWIVLHFSIYAVFDLEGSPAQLAEDLVKRTYITLGFAAFVLLVPLAVTSTQGWQRRLKRRWTVLHRLIYPAAMLGVLHFVWLVKSDLREPLLYAAILAGLLLVRLRWAAILRGLPSSPRAPP